MVGIILIIYSRNHLSKTLKLHKMLSFMIGTNYTANITIIGEYLLLTTKPNEIKIPHVNWEKL